MEKLTKIVVEAVSQDNLDAVNEVINQTAKFKDNDKKMTKFDLAPTIQSNYLPAKGKFVSIVVDESNDDENFHNIRLTTTENGSISLSALLRIAFFGAAEDVFFKASRELSQLKGAGVLGGTKSVNPDLQKLINVNKYSLREFCAFLIGKEFESETTQSITYFPKDGENGPKAEALNELTLTQKKALCAFQELYKVVIL